MHAGNGGRGFYERVRTKLPQLLAQRVLCHILCGCNYTPVSGHLHLSNGVIETEGGREVGIVINVIFTRARIQTAHSVC